MCININLLQDYEQGNLILQKYMHNNVAYITVRNDRFVLFSIQSWKVILLSCTQ